MDKYIGRLLDNRYEILEVIGTGGMAVVYKARCHRLNRLVAIKILKDDYFQDEEFRRRFHAESQAVAMLSHPNIVSVYDVSTSDDADYIVMELIDGISLKQYMEKKGVLNWKETLHFAIQIAKALDHAHSRGIVHRDIKPHNVMVLKNGSVKVADFGIARVMSKSNTLTKEALGSVHYISPEQAKGGSVDNRSDLYSLGVVMYEMMTGRPPYDGETPVSVAIQHINGKPQMPSTLNPNIPGGLEQIIMKVMDQEPDKRYSSAQALLYDMDEFRKDPSILFDYHNTSTELDDAMRIKSAAPAGEASPKTGAAPERPVRRPAESTAHKTAVKTAARKPATRQRHRREEIIEEEERGGKAAKISIIVCSAVAVIAIIVFLVALLGNNGLNNAQNTVAVPNLLNANLEDATQATDYIVEVEKWVYSSEYEKGKIIEQNPKAHTQINKGSTVTVIVSNGPEPTEKKMEDLLGLDAEMAKNFLINTQGIPESNISIIYTNSETVAAGQIFKTEPAKDGELTETTLIKLHVSTGPEVKTVTMVDFTSGGYTRESAEKWLALNGFQNVEVYEEVSDQPAGKIFFQNIPAGRTINVTTNIILRVSKGKDTTITLPPDELPEPDDYIYMVIPVALPTDKQEEYTVTLYREGVLMEERVIPVGTVSTEFRVSGKDTMTFAVLIDNEPYTTMNITFIEDAE
ncbi:MAG: Stk1 family PASTA domain-containing Ser/Thr kinase [Oscillospiraceae bacterium]|nr:Stk1 family PASTA domain-containing Ser/Thr kinase [Oscillospiraceae bacterium]